jgi:chromosome segregation ATPase
MQSASDEVLSSRTPPAQVREDGNDNHHEPLQELFRGLAGVWGRLVAKVGEQAGRLRQLNPRRWLDLSQSQAPRLQEPDPSAPTPDQRTLELKPESNEARGTIDELRAELSAIREQAAQANRLKQELRADLAEIDQIRVQLKEAYPLVIEPDSQAALEKIQELEALRGECGRLREEVQGLHSQLEVQSAEARERWNLLTEERDSVCAEREGLRAERAALERELEQTRDLFGAQRDALGREVDQLQNRLGGLERSHDEAGREHERERANWENQRRELKEWSEHQRRSLLEAEDRLSQQQAGFEAERQSWRRQLDEHTQRSAERDARLGEVEQLLERTSCERDALARRIEQLQGQLAASERRLAATELEWDRAQAAWEAQRQELQAQWEQQRRDLLDESEHRIKERQARFQAERQSWVQQLEEHEQMAAVWESLAQEVEQVQASLFEDRDVLTREVRQLRDQLGESEKSRTEAEGKLNEACGRWEAQRQELQAHWEQQRQGILADAERRLTEQRDQLEVERQARRQQADDHARMAAEGAARLAEVDQLLERTGRERDALMRRVEQLQEQLASSEQRWAATESERDQARAAGEDHRRELQADWERQRQDILDEAREEVGREHRDEHDRLVAERDALAREVEQLRDQRHALERSRAEGESEYAEAGARWEAQRQELQAQWEQQRQGILADAERRLAELRDQLEAERQARRQQAGMGRALESLRREAATLQSALDGTRRERDAARQQVEAIGPERDRLRARLDEAEAARREAERSYQAEKDRLVAALEQARQASEAAARLRAEQAEAVRVLRTELEPYRRDRAALEAETRRNLVALQREWENERRCWLELLGAGRPEALRDNPALMKDLAPFPHGDLFKRSSAAVPSQDATAGSDVEPITPAPSPLKRNDRPMRRLGVATVLRPRPQAISFHDPEAFRTHLEQWLAEARPRLQAISASPGRPANKALSQWLEYEIRTAREEIALLAQELVPGGVNVTCIEPPPPVGFPDLLEPPSSDG